MESDTQSSAFFSLVFMKNIRVFRTQQLGNVCTPVQIAYSYMIEHGHTYRHFHKPGTLSPQTSPIWIFCTWKTWKIWKSSRLLAFLPPIHDLGQGVNISHLLHVSFLRRNKYCHLPFPLSLQVLVSLSAFSQAPSCRQDRSVAYCLLTASTTTV